MKGVCFSGVQSVAWDSVEDPRLEASTDVIVQVDLAGLCGSDLHPYFGREQGLDPGTVMGHEFVGRIVEKGSAVQRLNIGDRVYAPFSTNCGSCFYCQSGLTSRCQYGQLFGWRSQGIGLHGGQAEFVRVPLADGTLLPIPHELSDEICLLLGDNLSTGYFCADMAHVRPDQTVVVVGCGTVGLLGILAAQWMQPRKIIAIDLNPQRRAKALEFGAEIALAPGEEALQRIHDATDGRGADCVMELVGLLDAQKFAMQSLRPGGILSVIGCHSTSHFAFSPVDAYDKNLTYRTGRCPARHYMEQLIDKANQSASQLESLFTHRFAPSDAQRAYTVFSGQKEGCMKAVFDFRR